MCAELGSFCKTARGWMLRVCGIEVTLQTAEIHDSLLIPGIFSVVFL